MKLHIELDLTQPLTTQITSQTGSGVIELSLECNKLSTLPAVDIAAGLAAIPSNVVSLDLRSNELGAKSVGELITIVEAIPSTVTSLGLGSNGLGSKSVDELIAIVGAIPSTVTSLKLGGNELGRMTEAELGAFLAAIPPTVSTLSLSNSELGEGVVNALPQLSPSVTSLDLGWNQLCTKPLAHSVALIKAIPSTVTSLGLAGNGGMAVAELRVFLGAISPTVTSLDLTDNGLDELTGEEIVAIISAIPITVGSVDLSGNFSSFRERTKEDLETLVNGLIASGLAITTDDKRIQRKLDTNRKAKHSTMYSTFFAYKDPLVPGGCLNLILQYMPS